MKQSSVFSRQSLVAVVSPNRQSSVRVVSHQSVVNRHSVVNRQSVISLRSGIVPGLSRRSLSDCRLGLTTETDDCFTLSPTRSRCFSSRIPSNCTTRRPPAADDPCSE